MRSLPLLPVALCLASAPALAAPSAVKLSWASADAATTMAMSWVTPTDLPSTIEYGVQSTSEHMLTGPAAALIDGIGWFHELELSGLMPNTTYRYRVGSAGDWSPEYTFKTAPNDGCTPFAFVSLGDARSQDSRGPSLNWSSIHTEAEAAGAEFFLNGGDLVREGNDIAQWAQWLQDSEMVNPRRPMMPAMGNHDDGPGDGNSANYNRLFVLPTNPVTGTEDYYSFVYNNVVVFSLSTQTFEDWTAQMQWLTNVAAQHPDKWKIAFFHHPVYTTQTALFGISVGHGPNEKGQNAFYAPAFDAAGIDIVVQSHNHIYERFLPLRFDPNDLDNGQQVAQYGNGPGEGRLYVVSGGSGAFLDPLIEGQFQDFGVGSTVRSKDHHFIRIAVAGNTLHYQAIRTNAGNTSGGGTVIDDLTLARPGQDPCIQPGDPDMDMDGYPASIDCNDQVFDINPGATEICGNAIDENCDGTAEPCPPPPVDMDGDGSPAGTDCDDTNPNRYPEHPEVECDGIDNDCDCLEVCDGVETDVCAPAPDAGPATDATPGPDAEAPDATSPVDAGQSAPDAGQPAADAGTPSATEDAGAAPPPAADGCGCRDTTGGAGGLAWLLPLGALALRRRLRR
ncbi:MAG: fibronectin type III domain-containing protein [Deltaproteobacteria bacterium]|nr:fibronectin type III domain-containing protein [Deltaproteobacteria bacterium]